MKISACLVLSLLLIAVSTLKLHTTQHQYEDVNTYLASLIEEQAQFQAGMQVLSTSVNETTTAVEGTDDIEEKIKILESGILEQQNQIYLTSVDMIPSLVIKDQCKTLSPEDITRIVDKCEATIQDLRALQEKLSSLEADSKVLQMRASANYQIYYLQTIQNVLNGNCTNTAILTSSVYQSNVYATNWILGNQTINDLVNIYIQRSRDYNSITNCPLETPFFNGYECINCVTPTPIFNMQTSVCTNCPDGTEFDSVKRECKVVEIIPLVPTVSNPSSADRMVGQMPPITSNDVACPSQTPFFDGENCINCQEVFNLETKNCAYCPEGSIWIPQKDWCQGSTLGSGVTSVMNPIDEKDQTDEQGVQVDPIPIDVNGTDNENITQLGNGTQGDNETEGVNQTDINGTGEDNITEEDNATSVNETEDTNTTDNATELNQTEDVNTTDNITQLNQTEDVNTTGEDNATEVANDTEEANTTEGANDTVINQTEGDNQTDLENVTANANDTEDNETSDANSTEVNGTEDNSTEINDTNQANTTDNTNQTDEANTTDNANETEQINGTDGSNQTVAPVPDNQTNQTFATLSNPLSSSRILGPDPNTTEDDVFCPEDQPFFNGEQCISCADLFNSYTGGCIKCPEGTIWNAETDACQDSLGSGVSPVEDARAPNISNPIESERILGPDPEVTPNDFVCPEEEPFFTGSECIQCTQVFNSYTGGCVRCPDGTSWNSTSDMCEIGQQPEPEMVSNITSNDNWVSESPYEAVANLSALLEEDGYEACPGQTPFYDGTECIICDNETVFNLDTKECMTCPEGEVFDVEKHKCIETEPKFITNPKTSPNLLLAGYSQAQWNYLHEQAKKEDPTLQDCPTETPYFDGVQCIACDQNAPYFDLEVQSCAACPEGSEYSETQKQCLNSAGVPQSPKLEMMASTVFTHHDLGKVNLRHRLSAY